MKTSTPHKLQNSPLYESVKHSLLKFARKFFGSSVYSPKAVDPSKFTSEELLVWNAISRHAKPRATQFALVHALNMIDKSHDDQFKATNSAMRNLREIVHSLRKDHHAPIASDDSGYYIPQNEFEVMEFLSRQKRRVRASIISFRVIYKAFQHTYGVIDTEFEKQLQLFDSND